VDDDGACRERLKTPFTTSEELQTSFPPFAAIPVRTAIFRLNDRNAGESCEAPDADA